MAEIKTLVDDLDKITPATPVTFYVRDQAYMIDLGDENADRLEKIVADYEEALSEFTKKARRLGRVSTGSSSGTKGETAAIRAWAKEKGYDVKDRGRVHADVVSAYRRASKGR